MEDINSLTSGGSRGGRAAGKLFWILSIVQDPEGLGEGINPSQTLGCAQGSIGDFLGGRAGGKGAETGRGRKRGRERPLSPERKSKSPPHVLSRSRGGGRRGEREGQTLSAPVPRSGLEGTRRDVALPCPLNPPTQPAHSKRPADECWSDHLLALQALR